MARAPIDREINNRQRPGRTGALSFFLFFFSIVDMDRISYNTRSRVWRLIGCF
ncbi:hypothetical protein BDZ91DRAFT_400037 [Kalaharituber pfeilii]|nr:hypothetical protein BDZ91DRAFT_400037 [Kalaharituber pfeilii]